MAMPEIPELPRRWSVSAEDVRHGEWFERDRANVSLHLKVDRDGSDNSVEIASWWDEDCRSLIEDGFLDPRKGYVASGLEYLRSDGRLMALEDRVAADVAKIWGPIMEAAIPAGEADHRLDVDGFLDRMRRTVAPELSRLPWSVQDQISFEADHLLTAGQLIVGYQILGPDGYNIHGEEDDPFGMSSYAILTGDAIETARRWAEGNPGYSVVPVQEDDIEEPEFLSEISLVLPPTIENDAVSPPRSI